MAGRKAAAAAAAAAATETAHAGAKHTADGDVMECKHGGSKRQRVDSSDDDLASFELWFRYGDAKGAMFNVSQSKDVLRYSVPDIHKLDTTLVAGAAGIHSLRQAMHRQMPAQELCVDAGVCRYIVKHTFTVDAKHKTLTYDTTRRLSPEAVKDVTETLRFLLESEPQMFTNGTPWESLACTAVGIVYRIPIESALLSPRLAGGIITLNEHDWIHLKSITRRGRVPTCGADSSSNSDDDGDAALA